MWYVYIIRSVALPKQEYTGATAILPTKMIIPPYSIVALSRRAADGSRPFRVELDELRKAVKAVKNAKSDR